MIFNYARYPTSDAAEYPRSHNPADRADETAKSAVPPLIGIAFAVLTEDVNQSEPKGGENMKVKTCIKAGNFEKRDIAN